MANGLKVRRTAPCVSLVFSAHISVQLCFSLYTALFYTLYLPIIAFAFSTNYSPFDLQLRTMEQRAATVMILGGSNGSQYATVTIPSHGHDIYVDII